MKVWELLSELQTLNDKGHSDDEVRILCNDANPLNNHGINVNGAFVIMNYPDSEINGVYITVSSNGRGGAE